MTGPLLDEEKVRRRQVGNELLQPAVRVDADDPHALPQYKNSMKASFQSNDEPCTVLLLTNQTRENDLDDLGPCRV